MVLITRDNLLILGILAVIVIVAIVVVYMPQGRKLDELRAEVASLKRSLEDDVLKASVVPKMLRQVETMKSQYKDFDRRLPKRKELGGFLREISGNLAEEQLSNYLIEPGNPTRKELFHTLPIIMKFHGSYLALASFLQRIDKMERLTRVEKLRINSNPKEPGLNIELQMNIYFTES